VLPLFFSSIRKFEKQPQAREQETRGAGVAKMQRAVASHNKEMVFSRVNA
jgi:hypothetical protein